MDRLQTFFTDHWTILTVVAAYLFGFVTSYLTERVKNRATLHDIKRLEGEKELIRKEHSLDIEKRKYKYESKRAEFVKYFNLLDSFISLSNQNIQDKFLPLYNAYYSEFLSADGDKGIETKAITTFSTGVQNLMTELNANLIKLRGETNTIKIIAGDKTVQYLNEMDLLFNKSFDLSADLIRELSSAVIKNDYSSVRQLEIEIKDLADRIQHQKTLMTQEIRRELDEI